VFIFEFEGRVHCACALTVTSHVTMCVSDAKRHLALHEKVVEAESSVKDVTDSGAVGRQNPKHPMLKGDVRRR
jgi:hypothetical protein